MGADEVVPAGFGFAQRSGVDGMFFENIFDRLMADDMTECQQRTGDSTVAPGRILPSHAEGQIYNRCIGWRSSNGLRFPRSGRAKVRGHQFARPTQDGVGRDDAGRRLQCFLGPDSCRG